MQNILITGAAGYIGSNLTKMLLTMQYQISIVLRKTTNTTRLQPLLDQMAVYVDEDSIEHLSEFMKVRKIDCVIHLATEYITFHNTENVGKMLKSNIDFGVRVLEAMRIAGIKKILYSRTSWQHFQDVSYNPVNFYAATKQAFEDIMKYYTQAEGFSSLALEIFDTYGEYDWRSKIVNTFKRASYSQEEVCLSPGEQKLDFLYIHDVTAAFQAAIILIAEMEPGTEAERAIPSGQLHTLREVAAVFEQAYETSLNICWGALPYRPREIFRPVQNFHVLDNWAPSYMLYDGFRKMYEIERGECL